MINLLPPDYYTAIRYGRRNTILRRWLISMVAAIGGLLIIVLVGWLFLNNQAQSLQAGVTTGQQQLKDQELTQVQKDAAEV